MLVNSQPVNKFMTFALCHQRAFLSLLLFWGGVQRVSWGMTGG